MFRIRCHLENAGISSDACFGAEPREFESREEAKKQADFLCAEAQSWDVPVYGYVPNSSGGIFPSAPDHPDMVPLYYVECRLDRKTTGDIVAAYDRGETTSPTIAEVVRGMGPCAGACERRYHSEIWRICNASPQLTREEKEAQLKRLGITTRYEIGQLLD